jgi:hypothetical protein
VLMDAKQPKIESKIEPILLFDWASDLSCYFS